MSLGTFKALDDKKLLGLTIYGEARGEPKAGKVAVGSVILERVKSNHWFGKNIKTVILMPYQFSCYLINDPNYPKLVKIALDWDEIIKQDVSLQECYDVSIGLIDGSIKPNLVATHYKTVSCEASWAKEMKKVAVIGKQEFFI